MTGADNNSIFTLLGASNHALGDRELNDYYATDPKAFALYPSSFIAYAWFVWEKGYKGKPAIEWIN